MKHFITVSTYDATSSGTLTININYIVSCGPTKHDSIHKSWVSTTQQQYIWLNDTYEDLIKMIKIASK